MWTFLYVNKLGLQQTISTSKFSKGAELSGNTDLWIGVSDIGDEDSFTYVSDGTLVNFVCESSNAGRAGKMKV